MASKRSAPPAIPRPQVLTERALAALERFSHIEAVSGIALLLAAIVALIWANSPIAASYEHFWNAELTLGLGPFSVSRSLHFMVNDGLMTVFFLVVGAEIRQEINDGALSSFKLATLPLGAALGGVMVPAFIYTLLNVGTPAANGWAVPTATDIAFAVGVLALLGKAIPGSVRILLLALAIIDDIVAILIIAIFYTASLDCLGLVIAAGGLLLVLIFQRMGIGKAYAYVLPGVIVWFGLLKTGVHPTLAGVVLGLMTPVHSKPLRERPLDTIGRTFHELMERLSQTQQDPKAAARPLKQLRHAEREVLSPVQRVQIGLHPWVAYGVMPLFALANAGVSLKGVNLEDAVAHGVFVGVSSALIVGKPLGVIMASFALVKLRVCELPEGVTWAGVGLVGLLAGIGFTMSIFISGLAFSDPGLLAASKLGVLAASTVAAMLGLAWGRARFRSAAVPQASDS
ncbi:Na+/H+ antiporter NhaA [Pseudomonas sp. W2Oct36]|uniref:Na+/H+ antiporter NhaA n=1 Tax=unclassified Pseudomonas TaxID=196821 RepID=UPI000C13C6CF|nr:Na+/H+ antiporter NhaA [Pseudomonas sp.]MBD8599934.1 Na+/H+ antiporter NhaA [Pseudomonas sp. CFBP 8772]PHX39750.1 sodium:proton antiporter [Pseudomonas sp. NZIPFR-PS5]RZI74119.1 MAG: Na+/H+ antiporter NhaA [Pseudomonas sp.]